MKVTIKLLNRIHRALGDKALIEYQAGNTSRNVAGAYVLGSAELLRTHLLRRSRKNNIFQVRVVRKVWLRTGPEVSTKHLNEEK